MEKNVDSEALAAVIDNDRSGYKEKILAYAISLGKAWGAELTVIHVIDPGRGVPGAKVKEKERQREEKAKREAEMLVLDTIDPLIGIKGLNIKKDSQGRIRCLD